MQRELPLLGAPIQKDTPLPPSLVENLPERPSLAPRHLELPELASLGPPAPLPRGPAASPVDLSAREKEREDRMHQLREMMQRRDDAWNLPLQKAVNAGPQTLGDVWRYERGDPTPQERVLERDRERFLGNTALYDEASMQRGRIIPRSFTLQGTTST